MEKIINLSEEKIIHYSQRVEEIRSRENLIYKNYESIKRLPKIISPKSMNLDYFKNMNIKQLPKLNISPKNMSFKNEYFLKDNLIKQHSKNHSSVLYNSISLNQKIPITDRSSYLSPRLSSRPMETLLTEESRGSLKSIFCALNENDEFKELKIKSAYFKSLKKQVGKNNQLKRIVQTKNFKLMNESENRMELGSEKFSEMKCFEYIFSKLAPTDYLEMKKKIQIINILRKKCSLLVFLSYSLKYFFFRSSNHNQMDIALFHLLLIKKIHFQ